MSYKTAARYTRKKLKLMEETPETLDEWVTNWLPEEFYEPRLKGLEGVSNEDEKLVKTVRLIQEFVYGDEGDEAAGVEKQEATPGEMDGKLGPGTQRRMDTWEAFVRDDDDDADIEYAPNSFLLFNREKIEVPGVHIIQPFDENGLSFEQVYAERKAEAEGGERVKRGYGRRKYPSLKGSDALPSDVKCLGTVHWDVCFSARQCFRVLKKKHISSGFGIENPRKSDGLVVVYQWLDFGKHYGYHGGRANKPSLLSFDMTNAVSLKYAKRYLKKTGIERPIVDARPHGKHKRLLGMYKDQILALLRILKAVHERYPVLDFSFPVKDGKPIEKVYAPLFDGPFTGAHTHLHLTKRKWDVSALEAQVIYMMLKDSSVADEFPQLAELFDIGACHWSEWEAEKDEAWTWAEVQG